MIKTLQITSGSTRLAKLATIRLAMFRVMAVSSVLLTLAALSMNVVRA